MKCRLVLVIVSIFCVWRQLSEAKKSANPSCRKPYFQLVFMAREKFHSMDQANMSGSCSWLNGCRREKRICTKQKHLSRVLWNARKLAVKYCESQFRYDQWNCAFNMKYFKDFYRETGYMQAIAAASLMYSYGIACSEGLIRNCECGKYGKTINGSKWHWGGCSFNVPYARRMAKKFLNIGKKEDGFALLAKHNSEIGFKSVQSNVEKKCRCHGVSGSCSVKTCWRGVKPFEKISEILKNEYHGAISVDFTNTISHPVKNTSRRILYIKPTLNLCQKTVGRHCNGTDNCATLCCGRGFNVKSIEVVYICNCEWRNHAVFNGDDLVCQQCRKNQDMYTCK
ncbi:protein Wnt-4 [Coccinella septempunctata]|uniref:protein Wnt-4 n=1 Tax=Coccinella septempunctata TaxID=41139 RepID=UPI001D05DAA6|nr:protein Wnt-4 [Coccinella septempunctata]